MQEYDQDNLLLVEALRRLAEETPHDIMAEHSWGLAEEIAGEEWLTVEDATRLLAYNEDDC